MVVLKFGGTSVRDAAMIESCLDISCRQLERAPVVVSSAMAGVTDDLLKLAEIAASGDEETAASLLASLRTRHFEVLDALTTHIDSAPVADTLLAKFSELESFVRGLTLLRECSPRTLDAIAAYGEILSTTLINAAAQNREVASVLVDARTFMRTDDSFTSAAPDLATTRELISERLDPRPGVLTVTQGFIGATSGGVTTTLGRGGSDYSASIIAAALEAREIQIWTDVHGIMTCDPRIVDRAKTVGKISYSEAAELAYFGAKVVHPSTIQPAIDGSIPVLVKNTNDPDGRYTAIVERSYETGVRAIAGKRSVCLVNITSSRMLHAYGFLSSIFSIFARYRTPVDLIATSEVSVSVTVDTFESLDGILRELRELGAVSVERDVSIVSLVGQDLWKDSTFVSEVFESLREMPIRMISLGASDVNLSTVVPDAEFERALRTLHARFFGS